MNFVAPWRRACARVAWLLAGGLLPVPIAAAPSPSRPNVILILADDLGYGDLGLHGNPRLRTPHLDQLGLESVRFTNHHVAPMCTPTRGELMTGLSAFRNGATAVGEGRSIPRRELPLLPGLLRAAGYATAHFGKWHLGDNYPFRPHDRGFELSIHSKGFGVSSLADHWLNAAQDDTYWRNDTPARFPGYNTDVFFAEAMQWIAAQARPFFAFIAPTAAHEPHYVPPRHAKPYEDLPGVLPFFHGMAANLDENVGRLREFLRDRRLERDTIVIYMTDNGTVERTNYYTAGMRGRKGSLYDGGHRVPFFLHWPGGGALTQPREVEALTHGTDLVPTLLDLCGVPAAPGAVFDGRSLAPLLAGNAAAAADRSVVVQFGASFKEWDCAVLRGRWRLVRGAELHDLSSDPGQARDVAPQFPAIVAALRADYEAWLGPTKAVMGRPNHIIVGSPNERISTLSAADWVGPYCGEWGELKAGATPKFGHWDIEAASDGDYTVSLHLFPPESGAPLAGAFRGVPARPVRAARLLVDEREFTQATEATATHARFTVRLRRGEPHRLEGKFLDAAGAPLWGAIYAVVERAP